MVVEAFERDAWWWEFELLRPEVEATLLERHEAGRRKETTPVRPKNNFSCAFFRHDEHKAFVKEFP